VKFTPDEGVVTVRFKSHEADDFRIEGEDTGIGIRTEDIKRLFVEFQQLDPTTAKKYSETGLGLALTKRFVEAQGGKVGVRSTLDKGSVFHASCREPSVIRLRVLRGGLASPRRRGSGLIDTAVVALHADSVAQSRDYRSGGRAREPE
jgi:light-regulated signal transduction histidine kinase (bacteriophytochrome)